jgi:hypothetical protein
MALSLRRETGPIIEDLEKPKELQATVTGRAATEIFQQKWADRVASPDHNPNSWAQLAHALEGFNPELRKMMQVKEQRFFDEEIAKGERLMQDSEKNWSDFVREHPEYTGLNPHLERGYKNAQARGKGQLFAAAVQEKYLTEGWANETDPAKVQDMTQTFQREWVAANVVPDEYDAKMWVDNFLPLAQQAEAAILNRNTNDRAREHLDRALTEHSNEVRAQVEQAVAAMDYKNPAAFGQAVSGIFQNKLEEMTRTGVPWSQARAALMETVYSLAMAEGEEGYGDELLEAAKGVKIGTASLGGLPEYKLKEKQINDQWRRERRQDLIERKQLEELRRKEETDQARNTVADALMNALNSGRPAPDITALMKLPGVKIDHLQDVNNVRNSFISAATHKPVMTQSRLAEWSVDYNMVREGKIPPELLLDKVALYDEQHFNTLYQTALEVKEGKDPMTRIITSASGQQAVSQLTAQIQAAGAGLAEEIVKARVEEAKWVLYDRTEAHRAELAEKNPDVSDLAIINYMREEALKIGKEPAYRDFSASRDILGPQEVRDRGREEYWTANQTKHLGEKKDAKATIDSYIRNRKEIVKQVSSGYNIPLNMVDVFIGNQARLYGWDLISMQSEYVNTIQEQERRAKMASVGMPPWVHFTDEPKEEEAH